MVKVGITGGIGSGKSIVCKVFAQLGVPIYSSDIEAKNLYEKTEIKEQVKTVFGPIIFDHEGNIDKKKLAQLIFKEQSLRFKLNEIIHPAVKKHFEEWLLMYPSSKYILKEAAILFESGANKGLDKVITVTAPKELKIERTIKRDHINSEEVEKRIASQLSDEEKIRQSDFVIVNDENQLVMPQVLSIHNHLISSPTIV